MFRRRILLAASILILASGPLFSGQSAKGYLFIIGGGTRSEEMMQRFVFLAQRSLHKKTAIFPMASGSPEESGQSMKDELIGLGLPDVEFYVLNHEQALQADSASILDGVGSIYFTGGDQSRLTEALVGTTVHSRLLEIYKEGGVIGGTSAGAAVMSGIMITGNEKRPVEEGDEAFEQILSDNIEVTPGFGFIETAIIDQHFVARKRHNRLISLVTEHPDLLGIGIDESTAIIVHPDGSFEVIGDQNVIVYDAGGAEIEILKSGRLSAFNIRLHILKSKDRFDLTSREPKRWNDNMLDNRTGVFFQNQGNQ
ncbi:cyanophycinase [Acidobacteriota bacterium]